mmetsp:Transcript_2801/g.6276  ORF Transcript_2801/g.6276 Transcript_2801/m.6276 type:complete len:183 (+) Transcript_2801:417-965(+)
MYQKSRISLFYLSMLDCAIHRLANGMFPMPSPWYVWTFSLSFYFSQCDWALQKEGMFYTAFDFDQDISQWDVRNVKNMHSMFQGTYYFNQPIGRWNVENVKKMSFMFADTVNFHQNIGDWNVGNVQNMVRFSREGLFPHKLQPLLEFSSFATESYVFSCIPIQSRRHCQMGCAKCGKYEIHV